MNVQYINPYTDFGFKKLFGEEASKDLLKDFLNQLLPGNRQITELSFSNTVQTGPCPADRKAIFDISCRSQNGEQFIVEMQKAKTKFFKDRAVFYTSFPIRQQAERGDWDFQLKPVYCVAILDFIFDDQRQPPDCLSKVELKDQYCQTFFDKLQYIFIEMPRFNKPEHQLTTQFDKWLYFLKNLESFDAIPEILTDDIFLKGFKIARLANFSPNEIDAYEESLKTYRDLKNSFDHSFERGKAEGIIEGKAEGIIEGKLEGKLEEKIETAQAMKKKGFPPDMIAEITRLPLDEILTL